MSGPDHHYVVLFRELLHLVSNPTEANLSILATYALSRWRSPSGAVKLRPLFKNKTSINFVYIWCDIPYRSFHE